MGIGELIDKGLGTIERGVLRATDATRVIIGQADIASPEVPTTEAPTEAPAEETTNTEQDGGFRKKKRRTRKLKRRRKTRKTRRLNKRRRTKQFNTRQNKMRGGGKRKTIRRRLRRRLRKHSFSLTRKNLGTLGCGCGSKRSKVSN